VLTAAALLTVLAAVADEPRAAGGAGRTLGRRPIAPGVLAFGERFIFGTLTVATPYLASRARVGMVLGVFMLASVIALPIARHYAIGWGPRRLAVRSTLAFAVTLGVAAAFDVLASIGPALAWAVACGASAGALYASALVLVARSPVLDERMRDMGTVHAAGSAGHALGALAAGVLVTVVPGMLVVALPGIAIIAAATLAVWITVPDAARDCPVIGGIAAITDEPRASEAAQEL
jgi:MFS family permease